MLLIRPSFEINKRTLRDEVGVEFADATAGSSQLRIETIINKQERILSKSCSDAYHMFPGDWISSSVPMSKSIFVQFLGGVDSEIFDNSR